MLTIVWFIIFISFIDSSHFRGGSITWRPLNNTSTGSSVQVLIRQRYSWRRSAYFCNDTTIANRSLIGDASNVMCYAGSCSAYTTVINTRTYCTDYSVYLNFSSGEYYTVYTFPVNISLSLGYRSSAWFADLMIGANGRWSLVTQINTFQRADGYLNTSPVVTTLPIIYKAIRQRHVHVVQMSDFDGDLLKCRWSVGTITNVTSLDECGSVCKGIPGAILTSENCTLVFTLNTSNIYYAVALQIEDFHDNTSSIPMSSVPLQFLFYGYTQPTGCKTPPMIIGNRPNRACIGISTTTNVIEYVIAQVGCSGKRIKDFVTSAPVGMNKSAIMNPSIGIYQIILTWTPRSDQFGPQGFCTGAVDNTDVQSDPWCITFLVGSDSPDLIRPTMVQGSTSPIGTVFANQSLFSIQATNIVNRPTRNGTNVYFKDVSTNLTVYQMDCGWNPNIMYTGKTVLFRVLFPPWIPGHSYYITFDSGVASGTDFCKPESLPITDPTFWRFDIWNPGISSTTTATTISSFTIGTIITRPQLTTTVNTLMTTTGIVATSQITFTTTTTTILTTKLINTTTTIQTTTIHESTIAIIYPNSLETICAQPIALTNIGLMMIMMPIHTISMYVIFIKYSNIFDPKKIQMRARHKRRLRRITPI